MKLICTMLIVLVMYFNVEGQSVDYCHVDMSGAPSGPTKQSIQTVSPHNGRYLRANGDFKTLIVFVGYQNSSKTISGWPQSGSPENLNSILSSSPSNIPSSEESLSHFFKVNSRNEFRIYGDTEFVRLPYSDTAHSYDEDIRNALIRLHQTLPYFDYSDYDNRSNNISDLSDGSDGIVDKIVIILRGKYIGGQEVLIV